MKIFPFSTRKVGGIRFVKLFRFTFAFSVSKKFRPLKGTVAHKALHAPRPAIQPVAISLAYLSPMIR